MKEVELYIVDDFIECVGWCGLGAWVPWICGERIRI
jgi:hypothetical protein